MAIRILIADDHGLIRAGLRALLNTESDFEIVGEAVDGLETLRLVSELRPDLVLLDVSMPDPDGIEITRQLNKMLPDTRVLILTIHEDEGLLREAIRAGASGYIVKRAVETELIDAIHAIWRGDLYVHPSMTRALLKDLPFPSASDKTRPEQLTPRESEILLFLVDGYTNRQIAEALDIAVRTVESHRANLMGKLGLHNRVELVRYARKLGLLKD
jgi:two-component system response regulator NreC